MSFNTKPYAEKKKIIIKNKTMSYIDEGEGDAIVFQHGNPTSSYLWRNVMPHLEGQGRLIACDLIGMGDSEKLTNSGPNSYSYFEHRDFLFALLEELNIGNKVVFVIHDWGSALGFDWSFQNQERVQGIAYMEGMVKPVTWDEWPENATKVFQGFRSEHGENMVLDKNIFVEKVLPSSIMRELSNEEMNEYRRPFLNVGEDRRPTLSWPRQIPIEGEPREVVEVVKNYSNWMSSTDLPKLFINADPGSILTGKQREFCRSWPNQEEVTVKGTHFMQEDSPDQIGKAVSSFVSQLRGN
jgi:haloalkane dehalogenase